MATFTLLIAHCSRESRWKEPFEALTASLLADSEAPQALGLCYMEMASPSAQECLATQYMLGYTQLQMIPLFMATGSHVTQDIAAIEADLQKQYPHLQITTAPPIGEDPSIQEAFKQVIQKIIKLRLS